MTIVRLKWADTAATDLHLTPGLSSPELVRLLRVDDLTGETLTQDQPLPPDTKVTATAAGQHADGTAVCAPSWSTHVRLAHLGGPGVKQVDTVPSPDAVTPVRRSEVLIP
ncbi:hypothetical protein [Amycolatopsis sp. NPDC051061]|uniref:hypothetical protein n=1 Tax=Amycolatopsis sp. NPDC051061 TaxID=3155042 RepID=UPI0034354420